MATNSTIEWTEMTWNPVTGCSKVSEGCRFCYAVRMAKRMRAMAACPQHTFQVLTKRSQRLRELAGRLSWPANARMGVSIEDDRVLSRVADLRAVPAQVRFLSCEPLIGPLDQLPLDGISWVIVGGESGPGARPMKRVWVESIRRQCRRADVAFFFKQWGGVRKDLAGRELNGRTYDDMPPPSRPLNGAVRGKLSLPVLRVRCPAAAALP